MHSKIISARANKRDNTWTIHVSFEILDVLIHKKKHNRVMQYASKFFQYIIKKELELDQYLLENVYPIHCRSNKEWSCDITLEIDKNSEEKIHYMIWWIHSCKGREFII